MPQLFLFFQQNEAQELELKLTSYDAIFIMVQYRVDYGVGLSYGAS